MDDTSTEFGPRYDEMTTPGRRVYPIDKRPDVDVRIDDAWRPGSLRMWRQGDDGDWWAQVEVSLGPGDTHIRRVPSGDVRPAEE